MCVIVRRIFRINYDVAIVVGRSRIIAPNVCIGHLMIRILRAVRQLCVVSEDLSDREYSCGCTTVSLFFVQPWLVLNCDPCSPRKAILAEQYGKRSGHNVPVAAARPLKQSQFTAHRIPRRCDSQHELCTIVGNALGKCLYAEEHQKTHYEAAQTYL